MGDLVCKTVGIETYPYLLKLVGEFLRRIQQYGGRAFWKKYLKYLDILEYEMRPTDSHIWKGIIRSFKAVASQVKWRVGNGKDIMLIYDRWVSCDRLCDIIDGDIDVDDKKLRFSDIISINGVWDFSKVKTPLSTTLKEQILRIPIPQQNLHQDVRIWGASSSGDFSCRSAYRALEAASHTPMHDLTSNNSTYWKWVWSLNCPQMIKAFLWLIGHDSLATNYLRKLRHISSTDLCPRCNEFSETQIHALRDCPQATKVWELVINPTQWLGFKQIQPICWVRKSISPCFRSPVASNVAWHMVVIASIWSIWKARNKLIFEGQPECPRSTLSKVKSLAISWSNAYVLPKKLTTRSEIEIKWIAPPVGWCKLNTDGSVVSNEGKAAAGGLMRNERGSWIFGFSMNMRTCTITEAELLGLRMGLVLAWERRIEKIEVEIDSQIVFNLIKGSDTVLHPLGLIIEDCRRLIRNPWTCILKHTLRNGNRSADALAKLGHDQAIGCCLNWDFPPENLNELFKEDFG